MAIVVTLIALLGVGLTYVFAVVPYLEKKHAGNGERATGRGSTYTQTGRRFAILVAWVVPPIVLISIFSKEFWIILLIWAVATYAGLVTILERRRRSARK